MPTLTAGQWSVSKTGVRCPCHCPPPELLVFSRFAIAIYVFDPVLGLDVPGPDYNPWSDWAEGIGPASTWDTKVEVSFRWTGNGAPWLFQYRFYTVDETTSPAIFTVAPTITASVAADTDPHSIEASLPQPSVFAITSLLSGGPVRPRPILAGYFGRAKLHRNGFVAYDYALAGPSDPVPIFRKERVTGGGSPGCPAHGVDPGTYSGEQKFSDFTDGPLTDPAGSFDQGMSDDLVARKAMSFPLLSGEVTEPFGDVTDTRTTRSMVRKYTCDGAELVESLALDLLDEYTAAMMTDAIEASIAAQILAAHSVPPAEVDATGCVWRDELSNNQTFCSRLRADGAVLQVAFDLGLTARGLVNAGATVDVVVRWKQVERDVQSGLVGAPSDKLQALTSGAADVLYTYDGRLFGAGAAAPEVMIPNPANAEIYVFDLSCDAVDAIGDQHFFMYPDPA